MLDTICTLPLPSDFLVQALHPSEPILSVGLASGHVKTYRLPSESSPVLQPAINGNGKRRFSTESTQSVLSNASSVNGFGHIATEWATRRHKGSCRALAFSTDGNTLFSAGTDGLLKAASTKTGQVLAKLAISSRHLTSPDEPSLLYALSPQTLLLATDTGRLSLYDLREATATHPHKSSLKSSTAFYTKTFRAPRPAQTYTPHHTANTAEQDEPITSLTPLPPSSSSTSGHPKQWATTAASTLAVTDLRRGVLAQSVDQADLLLSSCIVHTAAKQQHHQDLLVGGARGFLTRWRRGEWADQRDRVYVGRQHGAGSGGADAANGHGHGSGNGNGSVHTNYRWQASAADHNDEATVDCVAAVPAATAAAAFASAAAGGRGASRRRGGGAGEGVLVAAGLGTGAVRFVKLGAGGGRVVGECRHDETGIEGVVGLGFDVAGRMITGGGGVVKVWFEGVHDDEEQESSDGEAGSDGENSDDDAGNDNSDGESEDDADSDLDEAPARRRKKRRKNSGKRGRSGGGQPGIMRFAGL